jgi:hypothetical protein
MLAICTAVVAPITPLNAQQVTILARRQLARVTIPSAGATREFVLLAGVSPDSIVIDRFRVRLDSGAIGIDSTRSALAVGSVGRLELEVRSETHVVRNAVLGGLIGALAGYTVVGANQIEICIQGMVCWPRGSAGRHVAVGALLGAGMGALIGLAQPAIWAAVAPDRLESIVTARDNGERGIGGSPSRGSAGWVALGLGWVSSGYACSGCSGNRYTGLSLLLRTGGTLSREVALGAEFTAPLGWQKGQTIWSLAGAAYYYPLANGTVFLKGGIGVVAPDPSVLSSAAWAVNVGLGADVHIGRAIFFTPFLNYVTALTASPGYYDPFGDNPLAVQAARLNLLQVGVATVWH